MQRENRLWSSAGTRSTEIIARNLTVRPLKVASPPAKLHSKVRHLRRTRVVGAFPDGQFALNLAAARLRHIAGTAWSTKRYLNIELLKDQQMRGAITA